MKEELENQLICDMAMVKEKLEGISRTLSRIEKDSREDRKQISENREEITKIKTKAGVISKIAGLIYSAVGGLIVILFDIIFGGRS